MAARPGQRTQSEIRNGLGVGAQEVSIRRRTLPAGTTRTQAGYPGEYPYTRGIYPSLYRSRLWTMRQYAGFGSARESNARYRYLLSQGQTGLSVAFDLPTQIGLDSDHPLARGEVGRVGVAIDSLEDMETLFDGYSPRARLGLHDHQRHGGDFAGALFRRGRKARR